MAKDKKLVESITSMDEDFAQWYTDVVKKAELCSYTSVKGCMAIKPAGYAIWENIQHELDRRFKETGVENVYSVKNYNKTQRIYIYTFEYEGIQYTFYCSDKDSGFEMYMIQKCG